VLFAAEDMRAFWRVINATAIAYVLGYVIALLLPMEGPYHTLRALHTVELRGGFFTSVISLVQKFGRVHGAAFPSLHVAGACVAVLGAWRYRRAMFWVFLPLSLGMMFSTVYGRYHYFADIPAGLIIAAIGWTLACRQSPESAAKVTP
jgi:membrane-associated phospholipid phosphatase